MGVPHLQRLLVRRCSQCHSHAQRILLPVTWSIVLGRSRLFHSGLFSREHSDGFERQVSVPARRVTHFTLTVLTLSCSTLQNRVRVPCGLPNRLPLLFWNRRFPFSGHHSLHLLGALERYQLCLWRTVHLHHAPFHIPVHRQYEEYDV